MLLKYRRLAVDRIDLGERMYRRLLMLVLVVVMVAACHATGTRTTTANASTTTTDAPLTATTVDEGCAELARALPEMLRTISQYAKNGVTEMDTAESDLGTATGELDTARLNFQNGNFPFAMTTLDGVADQQSAERNRPLRVPRRRLQRCKTQ
jgi:hypothetical protein